jgi:hypothetical protein
MHVTRFVTDHLADAYWRAGRNAEAQCILDCILTPDFVNQRASQDVKWKRARVLARQAKWDKAAADMSWFIRFRPEDAVVWHSFAAILVQTGEVDRYREQCRKTLKQFENTKDRYTAECIAKDCLLLN